MLREGKLDDKEIEIDVAQGGSSMEIMAPPGMEELTQQIQGMFATMGPARRKRRALRIREALRLLTDEEALKLVNEEEIRFKAVKSVEQDGIVFLDEIDKIASRGEMQGADVSRQGVQRDLLPLVEGTSVTTKYGMVRTDHVLFIASGAYQEALKNIVLAMSDRFGKDYAVGDTHINDFVAKLTDSYEKAYYTGIVYERRAKATLNNRGLQAYELFTTAMDWFEKAEAMRPAGNDDAILRWNGCARIVNRNRLEPHIMSAGDTLE
jgi:ATP-dependent HslUV protease ATP-binding subunit HslU